MDVHYWIDGWTAYTAFGSANVCIAVSLSLRHSIPVLKAYNNLADCIKRKLNAMIDWWEATKRWQTAIVTIVIKQNKLDTTINTTVFGMQLARLNRNFKIIMRRKYTNVSVNCLIRCTTPAIRCKISKHYVHTSNRMTLYCQCVVSDTVHCCTQIFTT